MWLLHHTEKAVSSSPDGMLLSGASPLGELEGPFKEVHGVLFIIPGCLDPPEWSIFLLQGRDYFLLHPLPEEEVEAEKGGPS